MHMGQGCGVPCAAPQPPTMTPIPTCQGLDGGCVTAHQPVPKPSQLQAPWGKVWGGEERKYFCLLPPFSQR